MDIQSSSTAVNSVAIGSGNTGALESVAKTQDAPQALQDVQAEAQKADVPGGEKIDVSV